MYCEFCGSGPTCCVCGRGRRAVLWLEELGRRDAPSALAITSHVFTPAEVALGVAIMAKNVDNPALDATIPVATAHDTATAVYLAPEPLDPIYHHGR